MKKKPSTESPRSAGSANAGDASLGPLVEYGIICGTAESEALLAVRPAEYSLAAEEQLRPLILKAIEAWSVLTPGALRWWVTVFPDGSTYFGERSRYARSGWGVVYPTPDNLQPYGDPRSEGPLPGTLQENNRAEVFAAISGHHGNSSSH